MHRFLATAVCAAALCWLQGCCCPCVPVGMPSPNIPNIPNIPSVETNDDGASISFPAGDGEVKMSTGMNLTMPDDFPADVPVYPKAKVVSSLDLAGSFMISLESEDPAEDIVAYYETELVANGWELAANAKSRNGATLVGQKKEEKRQMSATVSTNAGKSVSTIALTASRPTKDAESE